MKLKTTVNFDFGKLGAEMPKIIEQHLQRMARSSAAGSKEAIDRGVSPKLEKSTIARRKREGVSGTKPLYKTGALHRSIKGTSEGLEMLEYGVWHHKGIENRPMRQFIETSAKTIMPVFDKFKSAIRKAMHLSTPIKSS